MAQDGICGLTSNPTIFEKAISSGTDYDDALRDLDPPGRRRRGDLRRSDVADIQAAADALSSVYDTTHGVDGYVSLEVSPKLAHDAAGTVADARRLHAPVNRPNLLIKSAGHPEGLPAIRQLLSEGINVNVTLMFFDRALRGCGASVHWGAGGSRATGFAGGQRGIGGEFLCQPDGYIGG